MRTFVGVVMLFATAGARGQEERGLLDRVAELERRVGDLEGENRALRGTFSILPHLHAALDGHRLDVSRDGRLIARLTIGRAGWGESSIQDVAAVADSVAATVFAALPPPGVPDILVLRSEAGPRILSQRGPAGEYIILLNTQDRLWAQFAYQFAHELGHLLCGELNEDAPQHWFEESFCEALSIWALERMAETWREHPPYESWQPYAESLAEYAANVRATVESPPSLSAWYAEHSELLDAESYDRAKNRVVATMILEGAESRPEFLRAFVYLRATPVTANDMQSLLAAWESSCPKELQSIPREVAETLGVAFGEPPPTDGR
jgi:hypothetical protein